MEMTQEKFDAEMKKIHDQLHDLMGVCIHRILEDSANMLQCLHDIAGNPDYLEVAPEDHAAACINYGVTYDFREEDKLNYWDDYIRCCDKCENGTMSCTRVEDEEGDREFHWVCDKCGHKVVSEDV